MGVGARLHSAERISLCLFLCPLSGGSPLSPVFKTNPSFWPVNLVFQSLGSHACICLCSSCVLWYHRLKGIYCVIIKSNLLFVCVLLKRNILIKLKFAHYGCLQHVTTFLLSVLFLLIYVCLCQFLQSFQSVAGKDEAFPDSVKNLICSHYDPVYRFHQGFLKETEQRLAQWWVFLHPRSENNQLMPVKQEKAIIRSEQGAFSFFKKICK